MVVRPQFFGQSRRQPAHMLNGLILKTLGEARSEAIVEQRTVGDYKYQDMSAIRTITYVGNP